VRARRVLKHIPIYQPKIRHWRPEDDKLLGQRPDEQVAMLLGVSVQAVKHRRSRLGIRLVGHRAKTRRFGPGEDVLLGTESDVEIARRLGRDPRSVAKSHRMGLDCSRAFEPDHPA
jgi:hypothetical protein